jgi:serpin B
MTILLPEVHDGIDQLLESMTAEQWTSWMAGIDSTDLVVSMPKFTLEYELKMNDVLSALGMDVAFTPMADFTKMFAPGGIWIDEVKHKAFVQVDEEGTTAAAVTSVSMTDSAPMSIVVDRPFVFVIREKFSGTVLFMGKVMDPTVG